MTMNIQCDYCREVIVMPGAPVVDEATFKPNPLTIPFPDGSRLDLHPECVKPWREATEDVHGPRPVTEPTEVTETPTGGSS